MQRKWEQQGRQQQVAASFCFAWVILFCFASCSVISLVENVHSPGGHQDHTDPVMSTVLLSC